MLDEEEADLLIGATLRALAELPDLRAIVEVGSYCGRSTVVLGSVVKAMRPTARVWAIDPHDGKLGAADRFVAVAPSLEKLKANVAAAGLKDSVEIVHSAPWLVEWNEPIALLLIDGLHDYANVAKDFSHFEPSIPDRGYVAFHDYASYFPGVVAFVNELLAGRGYRRIHLTKTLILLQKQATPLSDGRIGRSGRESGSPPQWSKVMNWLAATAKHLPLPGDKPITTLFVNHWTHPNSARRSEIDQCLRRNLDNSHIDRVVLLAQSAPEHRRQVVSHKVVWVELPSSVQRPTYQHFFELVNHLTTTPYDLNIVANSDVFFDDTLALLKPLDLEGVCVALSRWEMDQGKATQPAGENSQDAWIFKGRVRSLGKTDWALGTYSCDWRIAWELVHGDYNIINPTRDVKHYHLHASGIRNNFPNVPGPYHDRGVSRIAG